MDLETANGNKRGVTVGQSCFSGKARVGKVPYWELASNCVNLTKSFSLFKSH